jgi:hypothetical protein
MKDPPLNDFPLQRFLTRALVLERPTLLVVGEGPISQDIAAVLIKCQQNFAVLCGILEDCRRPLVVGRWQERMIAMLIAEFYERLCQRLTTNDQ